MNELTTVSWVGDNGEHAEYVEADLTPDQLERLEQGKSAIFADVRRYEGRQAIAAAKARVDQITARTDELVTEYPQLKSLPPRAEGDE